MANEQNEKRCHHDYAINCGNCRLNTICLPIALQATEIDELGDFSLYELFNVDLSIPTAFMLERDMVPMALSEFNDVCVE